MDVVDEMRMSATPSVSTGCGVSDLPWKVHNRVLLAWNMHLAIASYTFLDFRFLSVGSVHRFTEISKSLQTASSTASRCVYSKTIGPQSALWICSRSYIIMRLAFTGVAVKNNVLFESFN